MEEHLRKFHTLRDRLTVVDGLLLFDNRVYVPQTMRKFILDRIHDGHSGIEKCRARARTAVFWIGINADIKSLVDNCEHCCKFRIPRREPLLPTQLPRRPWQRIAADFCDFNGKDYLIVTDYYSRYIEICNMPSTTSSATTRALMSLYARHGLPEEIGTDNGPQFTSQEFQAFNEKWDIRHTTSSPLYPQSNGEAESAVKVAKSILRQDDVQLALLTYRSTPLPFLGYSPAQLLMGRQLRSSLPILADNLQPEWPPDEMVRRRDAERKEKAANYYDDRYGATNLNFTDNERVYVPDRKESGVVVGAGNTPRSIVVQVGDRTVRRNQRHLRAMPSPVTVSSSTHLVPCDDPRQVPMPEDPPPIVSVNPGSVDIPGDLQAESSADPPPQKSGGYVTSHGRCVRPPNKLNL
jgi:transposase InsO family protein